nr:DUF4271 domain-containing protein [uncultured Bacteroides sp.]
MIFPILLQALPAADQGIPLPYLPGRDDTIALLLLCCFLLSSYILARSRKFLLQLGKDFIMHRERTSIFATSSGTDIRFLLVLILQTCILAGVYLFICFNSFYPEAVHKFSPPLLLAGYAVTCVVYLLLKWVLYSLLGWIFFDKETTSFWIESYSTLLYYMGFGLFLSILIVIYLNFSLQNCVIIGLILLGLVKILTLYKWIKLFCHNLFGSFLLILYFCALEITPCIIFYSGLTQLNDYLTIKF